MVLRARKQKTVLHEEEKDYFDRISTPSTVTENE